MVKLSRIRLAAVGAALLLVGAHCQMAAGEDTAGSKGTRPTGKLQLAVVADAFGKEVDGRQVRTLYVVPFTKNDRTPVEGELIVTVGRKQQRQQVAASDYVLNAIRVVVAEPDSDVEAKVELKTSSGKTLRGSTSLGPPQKLTWREYVRRCLDQLIEHGRDVYGEAHTPLFMAVLDADTLRSPAKPMPLDYKVRLEERLHRRGERGSNLWYDQRLLRALYRMSELEGDAKYKQAADDYVRYFLANCHKRQIEGTEYDNGMLTWGTHIYWDCYKDCPGGDKKGSGPHEILVFRAEWEAMHQVAPAEVERAVDDIWEHHVVDKETGFFNRHDNQKRGCDFAFTGGPFLDAQARMYKLTGNPKYLAQARIIADWHWQNRNRETNLVADSPGLRERFDGKHTLTTVCGVHAMHLLNSYRHTGDKFFYDAATTYIKAYDKYGWDEANQSYWGMLLLDGSPVPEQPKGKGYDAYAPYGHVQPWRDLLYSYEFTLSAGQAAIDAYELSVADGMPDNELLKIAKRWGGVIERSLPPRIGRRWIAEFEAVLPEMKESPGVYAEDYGRAISLFLHLYRATDDPHYLKLAESLADEAVHKLYRNGLFVGHPAKPYYETTDGVGLLLVALLELDSPNEDLGGAW
jgi:hypothetical protein